MKSAIAITRAFGNDHCGPQSVLAGLRAIEAGHVATVTWALAPHPNDEGFGYTFDGQSLCAADRATELMTVGRADIDGVLTWRICAGADPDGVGSHSLVASWDDQSLASAAVQLTYLLTRKAGKRWIWRQ